MAQVAGGKGSMAANLAELQRQYLMDLTRPQHHWKT